MYKINESKKSFTMQIYIPVAASRYGYPEVEVKTEKGRVDTFFADDKDAIAACVDAQKREVNHEFLLDDCPIWAVCL